MDTEAQPAHAAASRCIVSSKTASRTGQTTETGKSRVRPNGWAGRVRTVESESEPGHACLRCDDVQALAVTDSIAPPAHTTPLLSPGSGSGSSSGCGGSGCTREVNRAAAAGAHLNMTISSSSMKYPRTAPANKLSRRWSQSKRDRRYLHRPCSNPNRFQGAQTSHPSSDRQRSRGCTWPAAGRPNAHARAMESGHRRCI